MGEVTSLTPKIAFLARTLALCPSLSRLDEGLMDVNKHTCVSITPINKEFYLIIIDRSIVLLLLGSACLSSFVLDRTSINGVCPCRGSSWQPWSPRGAVITLSVVCMTILHDLSHFICFSLNGCGWCKSACCTATVVLLPCAFSVKVLVQFSDPYFMRP